MNKDNTKLTDLELVSRLISNDDEVIYYFFYEKYYGLFRYFIVGQSAKYLTEDLIHGLVTDFYLYMQKDEWNKLRKFQWRSSLETWLSVVAKRFFARAVIILTGGEGDWPPKKEQGDDTSPQNEKKWDIERALLKIKNPKFRKVIELCDIQELELEIVSEQLGVKRSNLYNIRHRAHEALKEVMGKEAYYD